MPENRARGMDISHWAGHIDWLQVKNETDISFAITKATEGVDFVDNKFDTNWTGMRRGGLIRGAYHFFKPKSPPVEQANHFLDLVGDILHKTDLPPILDVEYYPVYIKNQWDSLSVANRLDRLQLCLDSLEEVTGKTPIIYTSRASWRSITGDSQMFSRYPLWVANYGVQAPTVPANNWGGKGWFMWQYTQSGTVPGVDARTDLNWFYADLEVLRSFLRITGTRPLAPEVTNGEMLQAFKAAANETSGDVNKMLSNAGVAYIKESGLSERPYDGLALEEMSLNPAERNALKDALENLEPVTPPGIPAGFTNQDMINAFYKAAAKLHLDGWTLVERAKMTWLGEDREARYTGPGVDDMPLNEAEKTVLKVTLGIETAPPTPPPYPGLTNQKMINAFYKAAGSTGGNYWQWIVRADLAEIATNRGSIYAGPTVDNMSLLDKEKDALREALGLAPVIPPSQPPYPNVTNQMMINLFYRAAKSLGSNYWKWIERTDLVSMAIPVKNRPKQYNGPRVNDLPGLTSAEKKALQDQINKL